MEVTRTKVEGDLRVRQMKAQQLQLEGDRIEEDDLDVEQDEQHRDQVEADPEAEAPTHIGGQSALVGLALDRVGPLRAEQAVRVREGGADPDS